VSAPIRVLLVEDDPVDEELILRALRQGGYPAVDATVVRSRAGITEILEQRTFDVVVADYRLPDVVVTALVDDVRRHLPDVPFVVVSGSATEDQLLHVLRLGVDDYLLKDRLTRLVAAIDAARERRRERRERANALAIAAQRERELRHLQRVESIGVLTGGIAHDFNNLLTVILGTTDLALASIDTAHPAHRLLQNVIEAARRGTALTQRLLAFARRQSSSAQTVDLGAVAQAFVPIVRAASGRSVDVALDVTADPLPVVGDRTQFEQVLMNLILNARDASPRGSTVTVTLRRGSHPQHPAGVAVIAVRDQGSGIPPELLTRVFEPFFTTKPSGEGTGLGLSTSQAIVRQFGGEITVESRVGGGSEFRVVLPLAAAPDAAPAPRSCGTAGGRTVLVVEPEEGLRGTLVTMLERTPYEAIVVPSFADLPITIGSPRRSIDAFVVDAGEVPRARRWAERHGGGRVPCIVALQGCGEPPPPQECRVLHKPFTASELAAAIEDCRNVQPSPG
jgi:two-component system, cell cycle sensor histidine kinase and response regulator CckA